jgi:hypothetical protein
LAFKESKSTEQVVAYSVSWNAKGAPHGHLIEFGHWRVNVLVRGPKGTWIATKERLPAPKWVPAHPFLRPALDSGGAAARAAMLKRGRERLPEILAGNVGAAE